MKVELKHVEAHIEPNDILREAIDNGDIKLSEIMGIVTNDYSNSDILDYFKLSDIEDYLGNEELQVNEVFDAVKAFTKEQKALLLWQLLKG